MCGTDLIAGQRHDPAKAQGFHTAQMANDACSRAIFAPAWLWTGHQINWLVHNDTEPGRDHDSDPLTWLWDVTTQAAKRFIDASHSTQRQHEARP